MKIAFVSKTEPGNTGGVNRVVANLAIGLKGKGYEVTVFQCKNAEWWPQFLIFPLRVVFASIIRNWSLVISHSHDGYMCAMLSGILKIGPKVILHSHGWEERAFEKWESIGKKWGEGPSLKNRIIAKFIRFPMLRIGLRFSRGAVFVSSVDRKWVSDKYPKFARKLHVIQNGVDPLFLKFQIEIGKVPRQLYCLWVTGLGKRGKCS